MKSKKKELKKAEQKQLKKESKLRIKLKNLKINKFTNKSLLKIPF